MMEGGEPATASDPSRPVANASLRLTWPELMLLLVLAAVQFTHIVDFMIVMPLGPLLEKPIAEHGFGLNHEQFSYIVAAYAIQRRHCRAAGRLRHGPLRSQAAAVRPLHRLRPRHRPVRLAPNYPMLLLGRVVAGAFGGVGASATLVIVGDRFADAPRHGDGRPDVGLFRGVHRRRPVRAGGRRRVRLLAGAVRRPGRTGRPGAGADAGGPAAAAASRRRGPGRRGEHPGARTARSWCGRATFWPTFS